ncbi:MAG: PAS domain S-box protein [Desulfobulbaceae bacterium]|nr:PAS domain S-box protein [Desulfobulbaceae bacterium]
MQDFDFQRKQAEDVLEQLRGSNEELRIYFHLIEQSPITIIITDVNGDIKFVNHKFTEVTGYTAKEVIGANPRILNSGVQVNEIYKDLWGTIQSGHIWHGELCNKKKSGDLFWENVAILPIRNEAGEITNFACLKEDITESKEEKEKLRDSEERFRIISSSAQSAIIMVDERGLVIYWNDTAEKIFGWGLNEVLGSDVHKLLVPPESYLECRNGVAAFAQTGKGPFIGKNIEMLALKKDGKLIPVEISLSGVKVRGKWCAVGIVNDISERKRNEEELYRAKELAEAATKAKSDFLANMSHEIRTPLNAMIGLTHLVKDMDLNAKQYDYICKILVASEALLLLINDILDFSKIEAGMLKIETIRFSLTDVLHKICDIVEQNVSKKGISFIVEVSQGVPDILIGDPFRLSQILINLVTNGVKFTEKGEVKLIVEEVKRDSEQISMRFTVRDTGIGMSEIQLASLFSSFKQADRTITRKYGGTGLGLAICKQLVELMGGEIIVSSEFGIGSSFTYDLSFGYDENKKFEPISRQLCVNKDEIRVLLLMGDDEKFYDCQKVLDVNGIESKRVTIYEEALRDLADFSRKDRLYGVLVLDLDSMGDEQWKRVKLGKDFKTVRAIILGVEKPLDKELLTNSNEKTTYIAKPWDAVQLYNGVIGLFDLVCEPGQVYRGKKQNLEIALSKIRGARVLLVEDNLINQ